MHVRGNSREPERYSSKSTPPHYRQPGEPHGPHRALVAGSESRCPTAQALIGLSLWIGSLLFSSISAYAEPLQLQFYVPNSPPQGVDYGEKKGIMVEVAAEAARRAGYVAKTEMLPWPRTLAYVANGKDLFIAGLSRSPSREASYTWVYPVFTLWRTFVTTGPKINSYADGKTKLRAVATHYGSLEISMLQSEGFTEEQIIKMPSDTPELDFLLAGRVDALYRPILEIQWFSRGRSDAHTLVYGEPMQPTEQYIACSLECSPDIVARLQTALNEMDADGTTIRIFNSYTGTHR